MSERRQEVLEGQREEGREKEGREWWKEIVEEEKKVRVEKGGAGEREQGASGNSKRWRKGKGDDEAEEEFERWRRRKNVI